LLIELLLLLLPFLLLLLCLITNWIIIIIIIVIIVVVGFVACVAMPHCQFRSTLRPKGWSCSSAIHVQDATQWKPNQVPHQLSPFCISVLQGLLGMCLEEFEIILKDFSSNLHFHTPPALYLFLLSIDDIIKSMNVTKCQWPSLSTLRSP
jgi:energy-coupling factor transporter transmembrane protein EcfT